MGLKIIYNPVAGPTDFEPCCICRQPTLYWYERNDVALCRRCAAVTKRDDVPTKEQWFAQ